MSGGFAALDIEAEFMATPNLPREEHAGMCIYGSMRQPAFELQAYSGSAGWNHEILQCAACEN